MKRTGRRTVTEPAIDQPQNPTLAPDDAEREAEIIETIRVAADEESGADWVCQVGRVIPGPSGRSGLSMRWIFNCQPLELLTLRERLASEVGAGRFRVKVLRGTQVFKQYDVEIEMTPAAARAFMEKNRTLDAAVERATAAPTSSPAPAGDAATAAILAALQQQGQVLAAIVERLGQAPAPTNGGGLRDTLALMREVREMMPAPPDPSKQFEMAISLAERISKMSGAGEGRETGLLDLARELIPAFTQAMQNRGGAQVDPEAAGETPAPPTLALPPRVSRPANAPPARHAAAAPTPAAPNAAMLATVGADADQLADMMDYLLKQAAAGVQPNLLAGWVSDNIPPVAVAFLESSPDPLAALIQLVPAAAQHRQWFAALIESLFEQGETDPAAGAAAGQVGTRAQPSG